MQKNDREDFDMAAADAIQTTRLHIRSISLDEPWHWLARGFEDFKAAPVTGLAYGLLFVVTSYVLTLGLWFAGQAAWILEKFWAWTDCNGHPENVLTRDEMLDNIMMYWLPAAAASSARLYWESFRLILEPKPQIQIPVGASIFPHEILRASKRWCEERYAKLIHYNALDKGGHFAAFEQPATFVNELRACFRTVR